MKKLSWLMCCLALAFTIILSACTDEPRRVNTSAKDEQSRTEENQRGLNAAQPAPKLDWSLERDNLIKRFKLQNDRAVVFYMYVFNLGSSAPIGYYQVNKVSSVNSQLTNPEQVIGCSVNDACSGSHVLPSPAEDGSYGTNGDGIFGFTPDEVYIETNMSYITSSVPLTFPNTPPQLGVVTTEQAIAALELSKKALAK